MPKSSRDITQKAIFVQTFFCYTTCNKNSSFPHASHFASRRNRRDHHHHTTHVVRTLPLVVILRWYHIDDKYCVDDATQDNTPFHSHRKELLQLYTCPSWRKTTTLTTHTSRSPSEYHGKSQNRILRFRCRVTKSPLLSDNRESPPTSIAASFFASTLRI